MSVHVNLRPYLYMVDLEGRERYIDHLMPEWSQKFTSKTRRSYPAIIESKSLNNQQRLVQSEHLTSSRSKTTFHMASSSKSK